MSANFIPAFWYSSNNFGDALTHYLIKKISGKLPVLVDKDTDTEKYMVTGSILNNKAKKATVWGCGVAWSDDKIYQHEKICAVRGLLTGKLCKEQEIEFDEVYGDPALLLPRFYTPKSEKKYKLGILPHYVDTFTVMTKLGCNEETLAENGILIIDILGSIEDVIEQIASCDKIISSTLHGLITAHVYGVPADWTKFTDFIGGDGFKFSDYYSTTQWGEIPLTNFIDLRSDFNLDVAIDIKDNRAFYKTENKVDLDLLFNACPFKP
jgi:pyruvyltransferase